MASTLNPYLNFRSSARQAMEFYQQVFGGELHLTTFGQFGMGSQEEADLIMHGQLNSPTGFTLMGADTPAGMDLTDGNTITVCLSGDEVEELRGYFNRLTEGGTVSTPLEKQMWGDEYGLCIDRFGISWMANITLPQ